jgi:hypothetical protein
VRNETKKGGWRRKTFRKSCGGNQRRDILINKSDDGNWAASSFGSSHRDLLQ